ncbi:hypothetical protein OC844_005597 [Tilletia horrida]|nr:hypothetical protein OC844_005597 [Tilletia horrida]
MNNDPYAVLGLDAAQADDARAIRQAYRREALRWHPDRALPERKEECEHRFKIVAEAFEILSNPALRQEYDARVEQEAAARAAYEQQQQQQQQQQSRARARAAGFSSSQPPPHGMHPHLQHHFHHHHHHPFFSHHHQHQHRHGHSFSGFVPHDPFRLFDDFFGNDPIFAHHNRMMDHFHAHAFGMQQAHHQHHHHRHHHERHGFRSGSLMDPHFRDFEQEAIAAQTAATREAGSRSGSRLEERARSQRSRDTASTQGLDHTRSTLSSSPRTRAETEAEDAGVAELGRLFARVGTSLLSSLLNPEGRSSSSSTARTEADDRAPPSSSSSFFHSSSFHTDATSASHGPRLVSESTETRILNGKRQTVRRRVDAEGNETVDVTHHDGRRTRSINGVPQNDSSRGGARVIEL